MYQCGFIKEQRVRGTLSKKASNLAFLSASSLQHLNEQGKRQATAANLDAKGVFPSASNKKTPDVSGVFLLERVTGIEPALKAWEALILPLNYTRKRDFI